MSNESKYYVPIIDQFKVGFRYELGELMEDNSKNWHERVFSTADDQMSLGAIENLIKGGYIRVKVLDKSDVIECGWIDYEYSDCSFYKLPNTDFKMIFSDTTNLLHINFGRDGYFKGKVRNYNELKDVMRMLEIEAK
jgi:hypothetical protein